MSDESAIVSTMRRLPWKVRMLLFAISAGTDMSRRSNGTVNRTLTSLLDFKSSPLNKPINALQSFDITVDASQSHDRNLWFRLYTPITSTPTSLPLIVFFHGGAFAFMAPNSKFYDNICQTLARQVSAVVVSVNYRLAPEHRYPCQYEDGINILKFIDGGGINLENLPLSVDLKRCFIAGDSAGGNIAHHVTVRSEEHEFRQLKIIGMIAIQPFFGGEERTPSERELTGAPFITMERTDWYWKAFLPEGSDRDHPAANVFGPKSAEISRVRVPPSIVFVGGLDPLKDWQKRYHQGLKRSGKESRLIEYPNAFHGFHIFPDLPEWSLLVKEVNDFIHTQSSKCHNSISN